MNNFFELINFLKEKKELNLEFTAKFIDFLSDSESSEIELACLTAGWKAKGETSLELALIAQNILKKLPTIKLEGQIIDCCGTGGDGSNTFNISTTSAFLASALGVKIAKHGGRKTTSASGSIDFLEALQIPCLTDCVQIKNQLEKKGICFIASPALHDILGKWKNTCRKLGFSGQTGLIGTLTNPVCITHQLIGVSKPEWGLLMITALKILGRQKAIVVHGFPCLDEASLCGVNQIWLLENNKITYLELNSSDLGLEENCNLSDLKGGSPQENVEIFYKILQNQANPALINTICLNTGLILWLSDRAESIQKGFAQAKELIVSGQALESWKNFKISV